MRNPDEKPIIEPQPRNELEAAPMKITANQIESAMKITANRTESAHAPRHDTVLTDMVEEKIPKPNEVEPRGKPTRLASIDDTNEIGESKELPKPIEINVAKLKAMKREEEIAKAKLAMERKRKLAEKAAAKAAARAQKEAEKKIKEKEKQGKRKPGILEPAAPIEQIETDTKAVEQEETELKLEVPVRANTKEKKEKVRYRGRPKIPAPLPKAILKRKKSYSYWLWAAPAAVILAVVLVVSGYSYVARN